MDTSLANHYTKRGRTVGPPYYSKVEECEPSVEDSLSVYKKNLPNDAPAVFYLGDNVEGIQIGLENTNVHFVSLPLNPDISHVQLYELARKSLCYVFDNITTGGVYLVGHGIGALLIGKLLADKDILTDKNRLKRLHAAFLISGIYSTDDCVDLNEFRLTSTMLNDISPLHDNFDHLWKPGTRLYVVTGQKDSPSVRAQSRSMYDRLAESCDMCDMHYEIKEKVDRNDLLERMCEPNNFLGRLIRYDIGLSQTR